MKLVKVVSTKPNRQTFINLFIYEAQLYIVMLYQHVIPFDYELANQ